MTLKDFIQNLIEAARELLPVDASINHHLIEKNNGINMDAILIRLPEYSFAPTLYVNDYYKDYLDGMEISILAKELVRQFYQFLPSHDYDISFFNDYEKIKDSIRYMIIQYSANTDRLRNIAHVKFLDLAIIFVCDISLETGDGSVTITNNHLKLWHISFEELKKQAFENTPLSNPAKITPIMELLNKIPLDNLPEDYDFSKVDIDYPIYVLTNQSGYAGAACILYPDLLDNLCSLLSDDLYVIPSSLHEVLLLPISAFDNSAPLWLKDIISTVNNNHVASTDVLSYSLYLYSRESHELSIAV